jgi:AGCS family alanine or glycine:cation symporter
VDTVLLCTVTALCILVSDSGPSAYGEDTVSTAQAAFSSVLGDWAGIFFAVAMLLFAVATIICWAHYGMTCTEYLTRTGPRLRAAMRAVYLTVMSVALLFGAVTAPTVAWSLADGAIAWMTLLNLLTLVLMHREVAEETNRLLSPHKFPPSGISYEGKTPSKGEIE